MFVSFGEVMAVGYIVGRVTATYLSPFEEFQRFGIHVRSVLRAEDDIYDTRA